VNEVRRQRHENEKHPEGRAAEERRNRHAHDNGGRQLEDEPPPGRPSFEVAEEDVPEGDQ
jgi:hypothetical protein